MSTVISGSGRIRPDLDPPPPAKQPRLAEPDDEEEERSKAKARAGEFVSYTMAEFKKLEKVLPKEGPERKEALDKWFAELGSRRRYCFICEDYTHSCDSCPWNKFCPLDATVGPYAEIVCCCCNENPETAHPGETIYARRAKLKPREQRLTLAEVLVKAVAEAEEVLPKVVPV